MSLMLTKFGIPCAAKVGGSGAWWARELCLRGERRHGDQQAGPA
jgi:hypothetical protein